MSTEAPPPSPAPDAGVATASPTESLAVTTPSAGAAAGTAGEALQATAAAPAAPAATGVVAAVVAAAAAAAAAIRDEPFYWERPARGDGGGAAAAAGDAADAELQIVTVVRDNVRWWALQLFTGVEYVGEVFAEFLGMTGSRYDWALEAAEQIRVRGRARGVHRRRARARARVRTRARHRLPFPARVVSPRSWRRRSASGWKSSARAGPKSGAWRPKSRRGVAPERAQAAPRLLRRPRLLPHRPSPTQTAATSFKARAVSVIWIKQHTHFHILTRFMLAYRISQSAAA